MDEFLQTSWPSTQVNLLLSQSTHFCTSISFSICYNLLGAPVKEQLKVHHVRYFPVQASSGKADKAKLQATKLMAHLPIMPRQPGTVYLSVGTYSAHLKLIVKRCVPFPTGAVALLRLGSNREFKSQGSNQVRHLRSCSINEQGKQQTTMRYIRAPRVVHSSSGPQQIIKVHLLSQ